MLTYILLASGENVVQGIDVVVYKINPNIRLLFAPGGKEAVHIFKRTYCPVILINFRLLDMTGIECIRRLRSPKKRPHSHILLYTDVINSILVMNAKAAGATDCLHVPDGNILKILPDILRETRVTSKERI